MFVNQAIVDVHGGAGELRIIMTIAIANLLVYVVLAAALIPRLGARGAALSTLIVEAINTVLQVGIVRYLLRSVAWARRRSRPAS